MYHSLSTQAIQTTLSAQASARRVHTQPQGKCGSSPDARKRESLSGTTWGLGRLYWPLLPSRFETTIPRDDILGDSCGFVREWNVCHRFIRELVFKSLGT
jgi:hypothetical protein